MASLELYDNFPRELDFRIESRFMEIARRNIARHSPRIVLPQIFPTLSSTSILTQVISCTETPFTTQSARQVV